MEYICGLDGIFSSDICGIWRGSLCPIVFPIFLVDGGHFAV